MMNFTLYTLVTWFFGVCSCFVLLSSAAGQNGDVKLFKKGESLTYRLSSSVFLNEKNGSEKDVGFLINGQVIIDVIWRGQGQTLLKVELKSPSLSIKSRKASKPEFTPHFSNLKSTSNKPFLIVWDNGRIDHIFVPKNETTSLLNFKKGIASLLQLQATEGEFLEADASGYCTATYSSTSPTKFLKIKSSCTSKDLTSLTNRDEVLGGEIKSSRQIQYELDSTLSHLKYVKLKELHVVYLSAKEEIGSQIGTEHIITLENRKETDVVDAATLETAIEKISSQEELSKDTILTQKEKMPEESTNFFKVVDELRVFLKTDNLGNIKPAKAFLKLVNIAKSSSKESILKALQSKKNKDILYQLYDILGYVQTENSHGAVTKTIHLDKEDQIDANERYLWALSFSPHPNSEIVKDFLKKFVREDNIPEKVKETLILTLASMAQKLSKKPEGSSKVYMEVEEAILNGLDYSKNEQRFQFFRALKNLQSPRTIPVLLNYIRNGTQKEGMLSWRAIQSFPKQFYDQDVLKAADKTFFQLDRQQDSSSRAFAVDVLFESGLSDRMLEDMMNFVISNDTQYEIRQYTFQKINKLAAEQPDIKWKVENIIKRNSRINNYSGLSPRGLSTVLSREFYTGTSSNGSFVSVQEVKSGIVKRGAVDIVIDTKSVTKQLFSLGLFTGGLHSFVSNNEAEGEESEESITAGMELVVLGTQIRPFVFFNGQGELMGHVWSGTASEITPAFQILSLLQDHLEYLRLGSGFVPVFSLKGAVSFDLSGKIEMSLWNRNAESLIKKMAAIMMMGTLTLDTSFINSQVDFTTAIETQLNLESDVDFSSKARICMRLSQPDMVFRCNISKTESIPNTKYSHRTSKYKKTNILGKTYYINRKNNRMCNIIFS